MKFFSKQNQKWTSDGDFTGLTKGVNEVRGELPSSDPLEGGGGTYRILFVSIIWRKNSKNWRENSKSQKNFR